jgi:hypothetical protein
MIKADSIPSESSIEAMAVLEPFETLKRYLSSFILSCITGKAIV